LGEWVTENPDVITSLKKRHLKGGPIDRNSIVKNSEKFSKGNAKNFV